MLLKGYQKEIFRPKCNPSFQSVHCIAHLDQDIGEALPYLNATLVAQGAKGPEDCPPLKEEERLKLANYMGQFQVDI